MAPAPFHFFKRLTGLPSGHTATTAEVVSLSLPGKAAPRSPSGLAVAGSVKPAAGASTVRARPRVQPITAALDTMKAEARFGQEAWWKRAVARYKFRQGISVTFALARSLTMTATRKQHSTKHPPGTAAPKQPPVLYLAFELGRSEWKLAFATSPADNPGCGAWAPAIPPPCSRRSTTPPPHSPPGKARPPREPWAVAPQHPS
jgi:hypothetical protein